MDKINLNNEIYEVEDWRIDTTQIQFYPPVRTGALESSIEIVETEDGGFFIEMAYYGKYLPFWHEALSEIYDLIDEEIERWQL